MTEHLPTVASSVNLTSLELADCILEFSHLSQEVTGGIQAGARTIQASEQTFRNGGQALRKVVDDVVMPGIRKRVEASGGAHLPVTQWGGGGGGGGSAIAVLRSAQPTWRTLGGHVDRWPAAEHAQTQRTASLS